MEQITGQFETTPRTRRTGHGLTAPFAKTGKIPNHNKGHPAARSTIDRSLNMFQRLGIRSGEGGIRTLGELAPTLVFENKKSGRRFR